MLQNNRITHDIPPPTDTKLYMYSIERAKPTLGLCSLYSNTLINIMPILIGLGVITSNTVAVL
jgi:hypothetical protein